MAKYWYIQITHDGYGPDLQSYHLNKVNAELRLGKIMQNFGWKDIPEHECDQLMWLGKQYAYIQELEYDDDDGELLENVFVEAQIPVFGIDGQLVTDIDTEVHRVMTETGELITHFDIDYGFLVGDDSKEPEAIEALIETFDWCGYTQARQALTYAKEHRLADADKELDGFGVGDDQFEEVYITYLIAPDMFDWTIVSFYERGIRETYVTTIEEAIDAAHKYNLLMNGLAWCPDCEQYVEVDIDYLLQKGR